MEFLDDVKDAVPYNEPYNAGSGIQSGIDDAKCECNRILRRDPNFSYDMSGNKFLIIFNHYTYKKTRHYKYVPSTRAGTFADVKRLKKTFQDRGFVVFTHHDWKYKDIIKYISDVCKQDHTNTSCLAVAIMTHGHGYHVCAADRMYPVAELTEIVRTTPGLDGKPKLFFVQACREGHTEPYHRKNLRKDEVIPVEADCFVLYSCYEDFVSYRNAYSGSWMMQALCSIIITHHQTLDLVRMATLINQVVANKTAGAHDKQMPVIEFNMTKFLMI